jgi:Cu+-exporting ATPase
MELNVEDSKEKSEYLGQTFYFCSDQCRNKFDANPAEYVSRADAAQRARSGNA